MVESIWMVYDPGTVLSVIATENTVIEYLPVLIDFSVSDYRSSEKYVLFFDLLCYIFSEMLIKCGLFIEFCLLR